nr:MAG TPA: hypothetical protein [Caudoviricetes sp.]
MKSKETLLKEYFCVEADTVLYHTKDLKKLA